MTEGLHKGLILGLLVAATAQKRPASPLPPSKSVPRPCPGMTQAPKGHVLQPELNYHVLTPLTLKNAIGFLWHLQAHRNCVFGLLVLPAMRDFCFFSLISEHWCLLISVL